MSSMREGLPVGSYGVARRYTLCLSQVISRGWNTAPFHGWWSICGSVRAEQHRPTERWRSSWRAGLVAFTSRTPCPDGQGGEFCELVVGQTVPQAR